MSNNPYQSPSDFNQGAPFNSAEPSPEIRSKVNAPATGLLVYGILSSVLAFFGIMMAALNMAGMNPLMNNQQQEMEKLKDQMGAEQAEFMDQINKFSALTSGPLGLVSNGIVLAIGILTIVTSNRMKKFQGHTMSIVVSVLACIPCTSGCCFVGIPIGIWAIVVLLDSNVKAAFRV
jgi:hypothetical protein